MHIAEYNPVSCFHHGYSTVGLQDVEDLIATCLLVVVHVICCLRRNTKVSAISAAPSLTRRMLCSSKLFEREMWGGRRRRKGQGKRRVIGWLGGTCVEGCLKCHESRAWCSFAPVNFFSPSFLLFSRPA